MILISLQHLFLAWQGTALSLSNGLYCLLFSRQWALSLVIVRCQAAPVRQAGRNRSGPITAAPSQEGPLAAPFCQSSLGLTSSVFAVFSLGSHFFTLVPPELSHWVIELDFHLPFILFRKRSENSLFVFPVGPAASPPSGSHPRAVPQPQPVPGGILEMFGGILCVLGRCHHTVGGGGGRRGRRRGDG